MPYAKRGHHRLIGSDHGGTHRSRSNAAFDLARAVHAGRTNETAVSSLLERAPGGYERGLGMMGIRPMPKPPPGKPLARLSPMPAGDARKAINALAGRDELAEGRGKSFDQGAGAEANAAPTHAIYDKKGEQHYDGISAAPIRLKLPQDRRACAHQRACIKDRHALGFAYQDGTASPCRTTADRPDSAATFYPNARTPPTLPPLLCPPGLHLPSPG